MSMNCYTTPVLRTILLLLLPIAAVSLQAGYQFTTLASTTTLISPFGVAVDANGNVYVADTFSYTVLKISPAGVVGTLAGSSSSAGNIDANGTNARFAAPRGVAVD